MKIPRLIGTIVVCLMLALPAAAIAECWCAVGGSDAICFHAIQSNNDGCCATTPVVDTCCASDEPDGLAPTCSCTARAATDAVLPADSKSRIGHSIAALALDAPEARPAVTVSPCGAADRPPVDRGRQQATLCVWRE
ncbi:MAG: hypothetical protein MUC56_01045 [Thermoanaerobaculales bacterium]|nr:hypothetical protein [Thermoanaerobaculales bacterium]